MEARNESEEEEAHSTPARTKQAAAAGGVGRDGGGGRGGEGQIGGRNREGNSTTAEEVASTPAPRTHQGTRLLFLLLRNSRRSLSCLLSWLLPPTAGQTAPPWARSAVSSADPNAQALPRHPAPTKVDRPRPARQKTRRCPCQYQRSLPVRVASGTSFLLGSFQPSE